MAVPNCWNDLVYRERPRPWGVPNFAPYVPPSPPSPFSPVEADVLKKIARKEIERSVEENERAELERLAKKYDLTLVANPADPPTHPYPSPYCPH